MKASQVTFISKFRLRIYQGIAIIIIPLCFFLGSEGALRLCHYGYDTHFTIPKKDYLNRKVYYPNPKFTWFFFSPSLAHTSLPFSIPAAKPSQTYRIFVVGSSAAAGTPDYAFSFSRILEVMLKDRFPQVHFEVINISNVAINSHVIYQMVKDVSKYQGDLFILYFGNNEVVGPFGPAAVVAPFVSNPYLVRLGYWIHSLRIGQLTKDILARFSLNKNSALTQWTGMRLFEHARVPADDPRMAAAYRNFQKNLEDIIDMAQHSGASVILCTVASNVKDIGPFSSLHKQSVDAKKWDEFYQAGIQWETKGKYTQALERFRKASLLDDQYANLYFRMGRCYRALNNNRLAYEYFIKARDGDALSFRANSTINNIIRETAAQKISQRVDFLDIVRLFQTHSPQGLVGHELLYEHVHMNFSGNYLIAQTIFQHLETKLPAWILKSEEKSRPLLSMDECARRLAHNGYHQRESLMSRWVLASHPPFTNLINQKELLSSLSQEIDSLEFYATRPGLEQTAALCRQALMRNPDDPWIHYYLGKILIALDAPNEAVKHLAFASQRLPGDAAIENDLKLAKKKLSEEKK